ncbi:MAG: HAD-IC family P-type ATPase, partial [Gammaproteobacteria bacterium]|nr:HAD-IC family P-type ATPase [Gammaproteobacteria bacterium]
HSVNSNNETVSSLYFGDGEKILLQWQQQEILRPGTRNLLDSLKASGMTIIVASGDRTAAVKDLTQKLVIDDFYAEQSSRQKLELLRSLQSSGKTVMCIGDGINDAEFLQQADLSISFTGASELAQAQADILMAGTDFSGIKDLLNSARHLKTIYQQNLAWAISYNALMLPLAVLGYIQPWIAALGMSLSSLFVVLNSLRLSKRQNKTLPDQLIEASVI